MIRYRCPRCAAELMLPAAKIGGKASCPNCGQRLQIPSAAHQATLLAQPAAAPSLGPTALHGAIPDVDPIPVDPIPAAPRVAQATATSPHVRYAGDSWLPKWLWLPTRIEPPENSGETIVRFVCNILRVSAAAFALKIALLIALWVIVAIFFVCSGGGF